MRHESENADLNLAGFGDRLVAFSADIALAAAGYFLTLKLAFPAYAVFLNPHSGRWLALWTALFLVYQGLMSGEGRVSLGKRLVGIRVVTVDGEPLTLGQSLLRSVTYLVSSVLNLGFLWSLFNPAKQCWHDLVVGSVVVESRPRAPFERVLIRAGSVACLSFFAGLWYWNTLAAPRYYQIMDVAYAQVALEEIALLQKVHRRQTGRYADNLLALAPLTGQPLAFMRDMTGLFDVKAGIKIKTSKKGFTILARAMDVGRTPVTYSGS